MLAVMIYFAPQQLVIHLLIWPERAIYASTH